MVLVSRDSEGSIALHTAAAVMLMRLMLMGKYHYVGSGHVEIVRQLLDNGVDLSAVDKEGRTPAAYAKLFGHKEAERCFEQL